MSYKKSDNLNNYDVFPLVYHVGSEATVNIRPIGGRPVFETGKEYTLAVSALGGGRMCDFPLTSSYITEKIICNSDGGFSFKHIFEEEQEYYITVLDEDEKIIKSFSVYAVNDDLAERYPFIGDLHVHSIRSDGNEYPAVVCANYRSYGYDFMALTDHNRYYPSLEAIETYKDLPIELNLVPGEEVHLPAVNGKTNDVHIVNFGGKYSINAMIEDKAIKEKGKDKQFRSYQTDEVPDVMSVAEYAEIIENLVKKSDLPDNIEKVPYVCCEWIFDQIRKADGLGIFAHPNWKRNTAFHVPEVFTDYIMSKQPFDAFEVLGGENYYEHNGFQTVRYYEEKAKGHVFPIVGSTDSHSSYSSNRNAFICATMVFSPLNERKALINSIKDMYSVAIDTINEDFRLVGDSRLVRYSCFLLKNYFPLHDELCYEEGRLMKQYATGTDEEREIAKKTLEVMYGRVAKHRKKYFAF